MKYNWNSTRKTKKKNLLDFILQDITPWNHKNRRNCYFGGYFGDLVSNVEFNGFLWFCEFLKVSVSIFWLRTETPSTNFTKNFFSILFLNSSLLWAFMVQNFCKNSFSGGKSRKTGIPVIKTTILCKSPPELQVSMS